MEEKEFYSVAEVAKRLGLQEETIREYIRRGELKAHRFGKIFRIHRDDLATFIAEHRMKKDE